MVLEKKMTLKINIQLVSSVDKFKTLAVTYRAKLTNLMPTFGILIINLCKFCIKRFFVFETNLKLWNKYA